MEGNSKLRRKVLSGVTRKGRGIRRERPKLSEEEPRRVGG